MPDREDRRKKMRRIFLSGEGGERRLFSRHKRQEEEEEEEEKEEGLRTSVSFFSLRLFSFFLFRRDPHASCFCALFFSFFPLRPRLLG